MPRRGPGHEVATVWEPWTPKVGQRVRVLARPECAYCGADPASAEEVGAPGTVRAIDGVTHPLLDDDCPACLSHRYWVDFDDETVAEGASPFAACELAPLLPVARPAEHGDGADS